MNKLIIFVIVIALEMLSSCTTRYESWQKKSQIIKREYGYNNIQFSIEDIIICNNYKKGLWSNVQKIEINVDSIVEIFRASLNKINFHVSFSNNLKFHCDSLFEPSNSNIRMITMDENKITELSKINPNRFKLIPFIRLNNFDVTFISPTASSGSPAGGMKRHSRVGVVIYLFDNDELIYLRMYNFSGKVINVYEDEHGNILDEDTDKPVKSTIEQKHWDKLVELVMRDYIKGVNRYKKKNHIFD
jgi:hypothetical protein